MGAATLSKKKAAKLICSLQNLESNF